MYLAASDFWRPSSLGGPSLDLNFLSGTLDSRVSFSRASMAWQTDVNGALVTAPHNLLTESETFSASGWTKTQSTVSGNVLANPLDGAVNADKLLENTTTNVHDILQSVSFVAGNQYTLSFYAKAAERDRLRVFLLSGAFGVTVTIRFNLAAGSVTANTAGTNGSSSITAVGGGWYRCVVSAQATTTASANVLIRLENAAGADNYLGDGVSGVHLFGAQLEQHGSARSYLTTSVKNLLGYSEALDNAAWTKNLVTISANAAAGPFDGTGQTTADKVIPNNAAVTFAECRQDTSIITGATYTFSSYAKASGYSYVQTGGSSTLFGTFVVNWDLSTGTETAFTAGTSTVIGRSITSVGNGWYRVSATVTATGTGTGRMTLNIVPASGSARGASWTPNGTDGVLMWGAQLSSSGSLDAYVPTPAAAPSSAAYHGPRFDYSAAGSPLGLLIEEARTNSIRNNSMVGAVAGAPGTAPTNWNISHSTVANGIVRELVGSGTENGIPYVDIRFSGTATAIVNPFVLFESTTGIAALDAQTWTGSVYLRQIAGSLGVATIARQVVFYDASQASVGTTSTATVPTTAALATQRFTVSGTAANAATAWVRLALVFNIPNSTVFNYTFRVGAPQMGQGAFATSPILTTTASVTRAADVAVINPLGSWFRADEGTLFVEFMRQPLTGAVNPLVAREAASIGNRHTITVSTASGQALQANTVVGGVVQAVIVTGGVFSANTPNRVAYAYKENDFQAAGNGVLGTADTSGTLPTTINELRIGGIGSTDQINGHIRKVRYWPARKPNAELQGLTS